MTAVTLVQFFKGRINGFSQKVKLRGSTWLWEAVVSCPASLACHGARPALLGCRDPPAESGFRPLPRSQSWPKSFLRCNQLSSYLQFSMRTAGLPRDVTFLRSKIVSFSNSLELLFTIFPMFPALPLGTGCSQRCQQLSRQDGNSLALYVFSTQ